MPNEEEKKGQEIKGLSPQEINSQISKTINENLDKREQSKAIQQYIQEKGKNLSEEGFSLYMDYLEKVPLQEGKTPQEVIDSKDGLLRSLEQSHPKEDNSEEEQVEEQVEEEKKEAKKKEPVNKSKKIEVEDDNDPNKLTEAEELYSTPEGYVAEHNKRYQNMKRVNRFSTQLSVNS